LVLGIISLPLTITIFHRFFDRGYLFSKVLGTLFVSYIVWLVSSLKILPFFTETILLVIILWGIINFFIYKKRKIPIQINKTLLLFIVAEEIIFFTTLAFWSYIRGFQPDIQGLEKFMDFGFVNSILRTKYFPPADMWFAGKFINYYYFGHYITALLTKLTQISSAVTYNLMIATLFAFTFSLTFSLTANLIFLWKKTLTDLENDQVVLGKNLNIIFLAGIISALLISLGANFHPAYYNFKMKILNKPYCDGSFTYWYPNATRYIGVCPDVDDKTIHEFPSYSFIVSDLHGHVSDIPFVMLFLAISLQLFFLLKEKSPQFINLPRFLLSNEFLVLSLPMTLVLAIMYMTNQWDFPIYIMILGFILLFVFYQKFGKKIQAVLLNCLIFGSVITLPSLILILPFQKNFEPFFKGIDFVHAHSLFYQLLVLWGVPWFFAFSFLFFLFGNQIKPKNIFNFFNRENLVRWFSKILHIDIQIKKNAVNSQLDPPAGGSVIGKLSLIDQFVIILFIVSTILVIVPEIVYLKDIYISSHHRANTMFKLTYQSFMMYSILIGYVCVRIVSSLKRGFRNKILKVIFAFPILALLVYPNYSIPGYYGKLDSENYKGLYGLQFLQRLYPDDYKGLLWMNNNIKGQPVILEAAGDSYTDFERMSMASGLPTIQGWLVHEWLWRGSYDEPGRRAQEVQTIYETKDQNQAKDLLNRYKVRYVIVGDLEKQKYPNLDSKKFEKIGSKVFESNKFSIYKLN